MKQEKKEGNIGGRIGLDTLNRNLGSYVELSKVCNSWIYTISINQIQSEILLFIFTWHSPKLMLAEPKLFVEGPLSFCECSQMNSRELF